MDCQDGATANSFPGCRSNLDNFQVIFDMIPVPLALLDDGRNILVANSAFKRMVNMLDANGIQGLEFCNLIGCKSGSIQGCDNTECILLQGICSIRSGIVSQVEERWMLNEGVEDRIYEITICAFPLIEQADVMIALSDLRHEHLLEKRLLETTRLASLGELVSGIAHELNNTLSGILGFGQLAAGAAGKGQIHEDIMKLMREARRTQNIVANLLQVSRRSGPEQTLIDLNAVVKSVIEMKTYKLKVENIQVDLDLSPDLSSVSGFLSELQQVILNLANNATYAMKTAHDQGVLTIRSFLEEERVILEVADTGPGIPPEIQNRIFDSFFTTKAAGEGTGLGLYICRRIVSSHGGSISASNRPEGGAVFTVTLPAFREQSIRIPESEIILRGLPTIENKTILVVDDEPIIRELIPRILAPLRCQVDVSDSVSLAKKLVRKFKYDLIIADVRMPDADGMELLDFISKHRPELASRVCFITGDTVTPSTRKFLSGISNPVLAKPFKNKELQTLVLRMVGAIG